MFKPLSFVGGSIWGAIKAPFKWLNDAAVGAFSGGAWGAMGGIILAAVGPFVVPYIQAIVPGLENVAWLTKASNYMASSSFIDRLAFLGLGGAGIGAASGVAVGTVGSVAEALGEEAEYVRNPETGEQERVVGVEDGQKLGLTVGTIAVAIGAGVLAAGLAKKHGIIGGDEADDVGAPPSAKPDNKELER